VNEAATFLAVDLGASSGRVMAGCWDGSAFSLREVHRFANGGVRVEAGLYWDALGIWSGILEGLRSFRATSGVAPAGIGIDAWGVDYGLLDRRGRLIGNPYHYRDARTEGMLAQVHARVDGYTMFQATGVQPMAINTAYQLASMVAANDEELARAHSLLPIPDLFQYFLCGEQRAEYTEATTTQLFDLKRRNWSWEVMRALQIPESLFPPVCLPGTIRGPVLPQVHRDCGFATAFPAIAVASHDTASAVAAIPHLDTSSAFLSCGTWSLMGTTVGAAETSEEAYRLGFTNEGAADGGVLLLKNLTGLWILQECMRSWAAAGKAYSWAEIEQAASAVHPFGALIDPNAAQFQAPQDMPAVIAAWCLQAGQPAPQTAGEVARCIFESLSLSYRATLQDLERMTHHKLEAVRVVGGGAKNRFLCQMVADACQCAVIAGPVEAAALGNAMVQAMATGHLANLEQGRAALLNSCEYGQYTPRSGVGWDHAAARFAAIHSCGEEAVRDTTNR
jgi:sugar (pentulose or hexulose) kinase